MVIVFVEHITERLGYTLEFVFKDRGVLYTVTNDVKVFELSKEFKLNYSNVEIQSNLQIQPANLLFDEEILPYGITKGLFFKEECLAFNYKIDPLASIFYVLSRMEEYIVKNRDQHDRFIAKESILYRFDWMEKLVCERWSMDLIAKMQQHGFNETVNPIPLKIIPSFDIDNAYAFLHKGLLRRWGAIVKDFLGNKWKRMNERNRVLLGLKKDPYDTFEQILQLTNDFDEIFVFWLLGDYAKYDRNVHHKKKAQRNLIRQVNESAVLGIHPSYKSNSYEYFFYVEKERLEHIIHAPIIHSRQHFLMLKFPNTYRTLLEMGIKHDYTLGFAEELGFRAGTVRSFKWFDLLRNETTDLVIHPFSYMDGTLNDYLRLNPDEAIQKIKVLFTEVSQFGGDFIFIWHNETIGNYGRWEHWQKVFQETIQLKPKHEH